MRLRQRGAGPWVRQSRRQAPGAVGRVCLTVLLCAACASFPVGPAPKTSGQVWAWLSGVFPNSWSRGNRNPGSGPLGWAWDIGNQVPAELSQFRSWIGEPPGPLAGELIPWDSLGRRGPRGPGLGIQGPLGQAGFGIRLGRLHLLPQGPMLSAWSPCGETSFPP